MQTIEEYKAYTKQLEGEVGEWHHAYDALIVERNGVLTALIVPDEDQAKVEGIDKDALKAIKAYEHDVMANR